MDEWKYIDAKEDIENYNQSKFNSLELFLGENYVHINGRNNATISKDFVYNIDIHSYKSEDNKLIITRRKEFAYSLSNPNNNMNIFNDEIILNSSDKRNIENFIQGIEECFED